MSVFRGEIKMYLCWYYRYEMEFILEKYGFKNITYKEEFFRNENHMIYCGKPGVIMTAEIRLRSATSRDVKWLEELMNRDWGVYLLL